MLIYIDKFLKEIIILNVMEDTIFNKISRIFNVEIKSLEFEKDVPSILSKNGKIFYVNEKYSLESQVYSIFHTLAHIQLGTECKKTTSSEEKAAEILTLELLMPENEIKEYINFSLFKLKNIFPYCSYEAIAKRILLLKKTNLSIWYDYKLVFREDSSDNPIGRDPDPFEMECMRYSYKIQGSVGRANENRGLKCNAYFIKEKSKKEIILFTERIDL